MNILIPMAGPDDAFRDKGFRYCKSLIELHGKPMLQRVYESLTPIHDGRYVFVIRKEDSDRFHLSDVIRLLNPQNVVLQTQGATAGAACTALLAIEHIDSDDELLITNADQLFTVDLNAVIDDFRSRSLDAATIVFESIHPRWSYVRLDERELVVEAAEKRPISRLATAGFYYFRRGRDFTSAAMEMIRKDAHVDGHFYICPTFNEMILRQARIGVHRIAASDYISLARPEDIVAFSDRQPGA